MSERSAALNFILKLTDQVTAPLGKVKMGFNDLAEKGQANIVQMGAGLAGIVGAGVAITESLQPALEMNRRLAEVRSLGVAEDVLDRLNSKALEFSVAYGENAQEFVASAYDIQGAISGLVGSELATFTTASAIMAKATKASATTMSDYVGTMYGIFQKEADAMGKENWINDLASQTSYALNIFKTNGEGMSSAFTSLGASATSAGIELTEQMGILGTLQATMSGSEAGTKYKAFLAGVGNAQKELGLSFVDSQGRMLPMLDILEKLKGKFGDTLSVAESDQLKKAFGSDEAMALIQLLMPQVDSLGSSIEQLGKIKGLDYATNMAKTMVDPWQQFGAAVQALRIAFGQVLIPILTPLMERLTGIAGTLTRWIDLFPNIAKVIGIATLAVFGLTAGMSAITLAVGLAKMAWLALSASFLFNPMVWIVVGIVAVVAAVVWLIYHWDSLKASFGNTTWFQALVTVLTPVVLLFRVFGALLNVLWVGLQVGIGYGAQFVAWLLQLEVVTSAAKAAWESFIWMLTNVSPFVLIGDALQYLIGLLNKIPGIEIDASFGELPQLPEMPGAPASTVPLPSTPAVDRALSRALLPAGSATPPLVLAPQPTAQAEQAQQRINTPLASLSPQRPTAVPPGGLLTSIQNTQTQNRGTHVEKVEIHTSKPMTPLELENMLEMSAG